MSEPIIHRILVVEDEALIALDVQDMLESADYAVVGPVDRVKAALERVVSERVDAAILDVDLDGEKVWPVAEALRARDIPFVLLTGSAFLAPPQPGLARAPRLEKPVHATALLGALEALLRSAAQRHQT